MRKKKVKKSKLAKLSLPHGSAANVLPMALAETGALCCTMWPVPTEETRYDKLYRKGGIL